MKAINSELMRFMGAIKKPAKKTGPVTYPWDAPAPEFYKSLPRNTHPKKHYVSFIEWTSPSGLPSAKYVVSETPSAGKKELEKWWSMYGGPKVYGSRKMPRIHTGMLPKAVIDRIDAADIDQYNDLWNDRGIMKNKYARMYGDIADQYNTDIEWLTSIPFNKAVIRRVKQSARRKGRRIR